MAMKMPSKILKKECAAILESMKVRYCEVLPYKVVSYQTLKDFINL